MTLACALDISVRSGSFNFRYLPLRVDCLSHPHDHPQRTVRSDRLLASWWSTLSLSRSGVAWSHIDRQAGAPGEPRCTGSRARWARSALHQWTRDGRGRSTNYCAIFTRLLLSSGVSFWRTCILYGWRRRSLRWIVFSEVLFGPRLWARWLTDLSGLSRTDYSTCQRVSS